MIGFFDSGFGGLQTMKYFRDLYPDYDYIFLADNKNCPFGHKSGEEIQKITFKALNWLFDNGAEIVIVACNTAAAYSIRRWQSLYPDKKTLSITVPGVEEVISYNKLNKYASFSGSVGVLATQATIRSDIYTDLYLRFGGQGNPNFNFVMAPKLVDMVEEGINDENKIKSVISEYLSQFPKDVSTLVLGCTHFSVYKKYFEDVFDGLVIDPSLFAADKFDTYLYRHTDLANKLTKSGSIKIYTTGDTDVFNKIGENICGNIIKSSQAKYSI